MKYFFILFISFSLRISGVLAGAITSGIKTSNDSRPVLNTQWGLIDIFTFIEAFLLKAALPLVVVGVFLYIAWELLTADGNEEKMKKAWKAVSYSAIGLMMIALAYAIIAMASRLSL